MFNNGNKFVKGDIHVISRNGKWAVKYTWADRALRVFKNKYNAVFFAYELYKKEDNKSDFCIHDKHGNVEWLASTDSQF